MAVLPVEAVEDAAVPLAEAVEDAVPPVVAAADAAGEFSISTVALLNLF